MNTATHSPDAPGIPPAPDAVPDALLATPPGLARAAFHTMGTTVAVLAPDGRIAEATETTRALFAEWEATLSRFDPASELSRLNARAGETVAVGDLLARVLTEALRAARATDGLYDPTLLGQMRWVGYGGSFSASPGWPSESPIPPPTPLSPTLGGGWRTLAFDPAARTVRLASGTGLDFGGIAKGMAVDAALDALTAHGIAPALVSAGGDLAVRGIPTDALAEDGAAGTSGADDAWAVAVPSRGRGWTIPLRSGAIATSGIARRRWQTATGERHHLIDPRTGDSAETGLWSVSVVAADCRRAEVAAKVAFLLGARHGAEWLAAHDLAGLLIETSGAAHPAGRWPVAAMREVAMAPDERRLGDDSDGGDAARVPLDARERAGGLR